MQLITQNLSDTSFLEHVSPVDQVEHKEAAAEDDEGQLVHPGNVPLSPGNLGCQGNNPLLKLVLDGKHKISKYMLLIFWMN